MYGKVRLLITAMVILCISFAIGCATFPEKETEKSKLTVGVVKQTIIKGETNQAEILETFGSPNLVTKNKEENEVWSYNRMSFEHKEGADGIFYIFGTGSRAMTTATTKSFDLIITFDENDIVKDYSVISASY